jgi:hypothetical protein
MDTPKKITEEQMYQALGEAFRQDPEQSLIWQLTQKTRDPLNPVNKRGGHRIHPLMFAFGILALIVIGTFIYFGVFHHE